jgi:hypothetical protein
VHHQPFFHGHTMTLKVPAESLRIVCTRGMEFDRTEQAVSPAAGHMATVDCDPPRRFDPALDGWYGGDLHIHMNYSGDLVCTPADAARMQLGEGLHLANFVAANCQTSLVYDRGPGAVLDSVIGDPLDLRVQVQGGGVDRLALVGPDGLIAERAGSSELRTALTVREPTWIAAIARGPANPATLDATVFAHTSPVYIDLASQRVARRADAQWCLDLLGTLERFVAEHGHFERATRESRFGDLVGVLGDARAFYRDVIATAGR